MGQTLSEPVTEKHSESGQDERTFYGVSAMQGWRINMEDAHAAVLDLQPLEGNEKLKPAASDKRISFFGCYDGHGGDKVAIYSGEHLHNIIAKQEAFKKGNFEQALKDGFLAIDRAILSDPRYEEEVSGCTASVAIVTNDKIYVVSLSTIAERESVWDFLPTDRDKGNAGDSRSVLGIKGRAKPLSFDHKPQNEGEKARICAAGGFVDFGRVNGNLALSRALGDFEFKKSADLPPEQQIVTAFPDVTIHEIGADDEFLVVACDGIWDCQSSQAVVEFVRRGIAAKQELPAICENMMDNCLASNSETGGVGCDNMTMMIIGLLNGKSQEEWYSTISERVANGDGPCAPPEYAEFRGPGIHHRFDDSPDDYDMDMDQRTRMLGGRPGRIILLGDGTQIITGPGGDDDDDDDDDDTNMDDRGEAEEVDEDDDLEEQVHKEDAEANGVSNIARTKREETPAPDAKSVDESSDAKQSTNAPKIISASDSIDSKTLAEHAQEKK